MLAIELWDPAEGAMVLELVRPDGMAGVLATFDWTAVAEAGGQPVAQGVGVTSIPISDYSFNDQLVTIRARIPLDYNPSPANDAWTIRVRYGSSATDRSTISARIVDSA